MNHSSILAAFQLLFQISTDSDLSAFCDVIAYLSFFDTNNNSSVTTITTCAGVTGTAATAAATAASPSNSTTVRTVTVSTPMRMTARVIALRVAGRQRTKAMGALTVGNNYWQLNKFCPFCCCGYVTCCKFSLHYLKQ